MDNIFPDGVIRNIYRYESINISKFDKTLIIQLNLYFLFMDAVNGINLISSAFAIVKLVEPF